MCLNRTILELKFGSWFWSSSMDVSLNRTILELKSIKYFRESLQLMCLNRTILEFEIRLMQNMESLTSLLVAV